MSEDGYVAKGIDELPSKWDGFAKLVREGMGLSGFGVQIMDLPPDYSTKSHNESHSGQEELYIALRGSGAVIVHGDGDERLPLDPEHMVAVHPPTDRTLTSDADGLRVLCIGGAPGKPYQPPEWTTGE